MCCLKLVVIAIALVSVAFCIYQLSPQQNVVLKTDPFENEYNRYCMSGGNCTYIWDEEVVACLCPPLDGGRRCDNFLWWL